MFNKITNNKQERFNYFTFLRKIPPRKAKITAPLLYTVTPASWWQL